MFWWLVDAWLGGGWWWFLGLEMILTSKNTIMAGDVVEKYLPMSLGEECFRILYSSTSLGVAQNLEYMVHLKPPTVWLKH